MWFLYFYDKAQVNINFSTSLTPRKIVLSFYGHSQLVLSSNLPSLNLCSFISALFQFLPHTYFLETFKIFLFVPPACKEKRYRVSKKNQAGRLPYLHLDWKAKYLVSEWNEVKHEKRCKRNIYQRIFFLTNIK